jgi:chemotaxis protein histidine kinase CheA
VNGISEVAKVEASLIEFENIEGVIKAPEQKIEEVKEESKVVKQTPKAEEKVEAKKEPEKKQTQKKEVKKAHQSVRVDLERIDNLMNMVSELVIYRTRLEQIVNVHKSQELNETDIFRCFSPPLKKFLVEIKNIIFIDEKVNVHSKKICWIFIKSDDLNQALSEWKERGITNNKIFEDI